MKKLTMLICCCLLAADVAFAYEPGPHLVADYDRDGEISPTDRSKALLGDEFTIWINDDDDDNGDGDTNNDLHDVPCGKDGDGNPNDKDCEDDQVNGRCDLLDFFPVLVNVREVTDWEYLTWKLCSDSVNVVFTGLKADNAGSFHTNDVDDNDGTSLHEASVAKLTEDGVALPSGFLDEAGEGVFVIEGRKHGSRCLTLRGYKYDEVVAEVTMNLVVENVESRYGWMNLRGSQPSTFLPSTFQPFNSLSDNRHFVLVHGYNTNHEEARGNAAEFYKKLWQSGSDAMFTAVEWRGDQSQINFRLLGVNFTPNYYVNVENAFAAARPFAEACAKLPGEKILVGHSLGNMLISSAIKDYGLDYTKYVMLNAAVAREAFDANVTDADMVDEDWLDLEETPLLERASHWYRNFADEEPDSDEYRRKLAWRGRFANLPRTVNYYSQSDNILVNPDPNEKDPDEVFDRDDLNLTRKVEELLVAKLVNGRSIGSGGSKKTGFGFWSFSEKMKGTWLLDAVNDVLTNVLEVAQADAYKREGGWGLNPEYDDELTEFDPANTRFTPFLDERLTEWGMLDILPAETERLRAQHLADAIPAESFAAGANPVATLENVNMESFIGENPDWPLYEGEEVHTNVWNHSAFREVAFYHTSKLYASLAAVDNPRVIIDTDIGSSMDDLFTIDLAARMHKAGKLDLMAVMVDRPDKSDPEGEGEFLAFADRYLASLGFDDLPLGKSMPLAEDRVPQHVFIPYWTLVYSNDFSGATALMPANRTDDQLAALDNSVALYRRLLNDAPDKSVVICSIGFLNNLKALMESGIDFGGDSIYSTGLELIAAKVKELRIMGGCFDPASAPDGTDGAEYNFSGDPAAAKKVVEEWPTPIVLCPWEVGLDLDYTSDEVLADFPVGTPDPVLRAAYERWPEPLGEGEMNRLWDLTTILPLVEGETLLPLSGKGGIEVDEIGVTTFTPDASSNRCYQVASDMDVAAVMDRIRAIFRTGNPSITMLASGVPEPGVDYNGSEMVFRFKDICLGSYAEEDLHFVFEIDGAEYEPESSEWNETLGVLSVRFAIPSDAVTAGNSYDGTLEVFLENDEFGYSLLKTVPRTLNQGAVVADAERDWFFERGLETPINYVPATEMPENVTAKVTATVAFDGTPFEERLLSEAGAVQAAVRIVGDGEGGFRFQFYALLPDEDENMCEGWWDCNGPEVVPVPGTEYEISVEAMYGEDADFELYTVAFFVKAANENTPPVRVFLGNLIGPLGDIGWAGRLGSLEFTEDGEVLFLDGVYLETRLDTDLARIDGVAGYSTVADAVAAADGQPIRLMHAASWSPREDDIGTSVRFLNRSLLALDESSLPVGARVEWSDVEGNDGTLTLRREPYGRIYEIFEEICEVPHYSSHESDIGDWLMDWAEDHGFDATRDTAGGNGNVFIDVPATPGMANRALVVLQTHQDMVCAVKEGVGHDWDRDPVVPVIEDGWIHSWDNETSLGADDGIGMATALAIAEGGMAHGPLRLIMTVEEETTQTGVQALDPAMVADAKYLINIDSETEGEVTISSAIGDANRFVRGPSSADATNGIALLVRVRGLCGGHSGIDINRGRGNAIVALAGMISNLGGTAGVGLELASFTGGSAQNAIPTFSEAVIVVPESAQSVVANAATALEAALRTVSDDANATVTVEAANMPQRVLAADDLDRLLRFVLTLPNGVLSMSPSVPGLVQTSSNLGVLDATPEGIVVAALVRSSSNEEYDELIADNGRLAEACGFEFSNTKNCEAWPADPDSRLLAICTNAYHTAFGRDMAIVAVHAGLECGTFKQKNPALDMISIGPTVVSPHSIDEKCDIESCGMVWTLLEGILAAIPGGVSVTPGVPVVFDTAEAATNALADAVLEPGADVAKELADAEARVRYAGSFDIVVNPADGGRFAVEAVLTDEARTFLAASATDVTLQIPVAAIAALEEDATLSVTATNGVPGFYYTLHDGALLTGIVPDADAENRDVLCGADGDVVFPAVGKPSDAMGFFRVGVDAAK